MKKRYTVTSKPSRDGRGPDYIIYDNLLGAEVGFFDTEKWAESIAEVMEKEWRKKKDEHNTEENADSKL